MKSPTKKPTKDNKLPKKYQESEAKIILYVNEHLLQLVQQIRAMGRAAGVTPAQFHEKFIDEEGDDQFYIDLHKIEDEYEARKKLELQAKPEGADNTPTLEDSDGLLAGPGDEIPEGTRTPEQI